MVELSFEEFEQRRHDSWRLVSGKYNAHRDGNVLVISNLYRRCQPVFVISSLSRNLFRKRQRRGASTRSAEFILSEVEGLTADFRST